MGTQSFLVNLNPSSPSSLVDCIKELKHCSLIFMDALTDSPPDFQVAGEVSNAAVKFLDHIVNEIMRNRDQLKSERTYNASPLKPLLDRNAGLSVSPVTRIHQNELHRLGAGNGNLTFIGSTASPIPMVRLLNKIKHRRTDSINFRIESPNRHALLVGVDNPDGSPDCIVEFFISDFCAHCKSIALVM